MVCLQVVDKLDKQEKELVRREESLWSRPNPETFSEQQVLEDTVTLIRIPIPSVNPFLYAMAKVKHERMAKMNRDLQDSDFEIEILIPMPPTQLQRT